MPCNTKAPTIRWFYLTIGILSMLFAGLAPKRIYIMSSDGSYKEVLL